MATRTRSWLPPSLGAGLLWLVLSSCSAPPEPGQSQTKVDDCLRNVNLDRLPALLKHCDAVVEAFPEHPQPRNERALLLKLAGKPQEACRDSLKAAALVKEGKHPKTPCSDKKNLNLAQNNSSSQLSMVRACTEVVLLQKAATAWFLPFA